MLDANDDMENGNLVRAIRSDQKLNMKDLVRERACKDGPATCFCSTNQIDGAFDTPGVECCGARFLPFWYRIDNHRAVVVYIPHQYLLGDQVLKVVRPEVRRLQCGLKGPKRWYLQRCETIFKEHKVYRKERRL